MGATDFYTTANGKTAREAYNRAVDEAHYMYGHESYNGSISTTSGFNLISVDDWERAWKPWLQRQLDAEKAGWDSDRAKGWTKGRWPGPSPFLSKLMRRKRVKPQELAKAIMSVEGGPEKWGAAWAIDLKPRNQRKKEFLFFGLAAI